ncbi:MAG: pimeloyl-ACP methyl ester esterase BioH [Thiotrichales bacterium]|nr:pimeloyl-ACP methyl ester esterase BioH [Thiotrichales bacterium]
MSLSTVFGQGPNLCLIHGWGAQNAVWHEWAQTYLASHFQVHLIELPGFGQTAKIGDYQDDTELTQAWIETLLAQMPAQSHVLGWSLGGLLAQYLALERPQRVQSLICLASSPRFTQTDHWPWAVSPKLIGDFMLSLQADSTATLKHFWALQMQGSELPRQQFRHFLKQMGNHRLPTLSGLTQGLRLLKSLDFRERLSALDTPTLWLLGENDPLIPHAWVSQFSTIQPQAKAQILPGAAHTPFVSHPEECAQAIIQFITSQNP